MPGFDRDQVAIDNTVENRRLGSVLLTVGWILLWMDAILGVFFFISLRNGSWFWPIWLGIEGAARTGAGDHGNALSPGVGVTRLGQRELERTLAQQRQDEAEDQQVGLMAAARQCQSLGSSEGGKSQRDARRTGRRRLCHRRKKNAKTAQLMVIIGWVMMLFAFLVMFFHPAAVSWARSRFDVIAGCLAR